MIEPSPQMIIYTPANWHWLVLDTGKVFSSAARSYVDALPKGAPFTRIANEAELFDVLRFAAPQCLPAVVLSAEEQREQLPPLSTPRMKAMLRISGKMAAVNAAIAAIPDDNARIFAEETLAGSGTYHRTNPLTEQIRQAIGMTAEELDALWATAAAL